MGTKITNTDLELSLSMRKVSNIFARAFGARVKVEISVLGVEMVQSLEARPLGRSESNTRTASARQSGEV